MKEISAFIDRKKDEFSRLPFFDYLRNTSISPMQRLAFAPCVVPFVMSFGELNKVVFRDEPTNDPIQSIINNHTYEDDHHWMWLLEDLETLGLNPQKPFTQTVQFLWGEETRLGRRAAYELYRLVVNAIPIQKLVTIESIEATSNCFLAITSQVVQELQSASAKQAKQTEYRFFGACHLQVDTGHTYSSPKAKQIVESVEVTEAFKQESFELIEHVFSVFTDFLGELLAYAQAHRFDQDADASINQNHQNFKPIGKYLLEAGLVDSDQLQDALSQQQLTYMPIGRILSSQGYVNQETIEYLVEKVVVPERNLSLINEKGLVSTAEAEKRLVLS